MESIDAAHLVHAPEQKDAARAEEQDAAEIVAEQAERREGAAENEKGAGRMVRRKDGREFGSRRFHTPWARSVEIAFPRLWEPVWRQNLPRTIMRVRDIMTPSPACAAPTDTLESIARLMVVHDCGSIPVCEGEGVKRVVGIITDRDIVIRAVAAGRNPLELKASDVMSHPIASVLSDADLDSAIKTMEENQIRRAPVVDHQGTLVGLVAQADIARNAPPTQAGHLVEAVSKGVDLGGL